MTDEFKKQLIEEEPAKPRPSRPLMIVVSAPSGAGKSTLCKRLVDEFSNIVYSVSCTTRPPRGEEKDGNDYFFLSKKEFKQRLKKNEFIESAKVHGNYYGTLEDTVVYAMEEGNHVLLDIDVQGVNEIRSSLERLSKRHPIRRGFLDIFISPPSIEELEKRLRGRATDDDTVIRRRLKNAEEEMKCIPDYTHHVINDNLDSAYQELRKIIKTEMGLPE